MANNHQCITYTDPSNQYTIYMVKTSANNIQVVNLTNSTNTRGSKIEDTPYYGINGGWYKDQTCSDGKNYNYVETIAYNNGNPQGPLSDGGDAGGVAYYAGARNLVGRSMIYYKNSMLYYTSNVTSDASAQVPKTANSWAQGGIGLYLGDPDWLQRFRNEPCDEDYSIGTDPRSGLLVNPNTKDVYLVAATATYFTVADFRHAIMSYLGLSDNNSTVWKAILLDGGGSCQLRGENFNKWPPFLPPRKVVPQIIALKDKT